MNDDNLTDSDFLLDCHIATGDLLNLAQSLTRSIEAIETQTEATGTGYHPDRVLVKLLAERIKDLNEKIGDRL